MEKNIPAKVQLRSLAQRVQTIIQIVVQLDDFSFQMHHGLLVLLPLLHEVLGDVQRRKDRNGEGWLLWDLIVNLRQHGIDVGRNPLGKILVLPPEGILGTEYLDLDAFTVHKMLNNVSPCRGMYP